MRAPSRAFALTVCAALLATPAVGAVYRCVEPDTPVGFTQFGCPPRALREPVDPGPVSAIAELELSDEERRQLDALETRIERERAAARKRDAAAMRERLKARADSARQCNEARTELERLARLRRGGYPAAQARALDEAARRSEAQERQHC